MSLVSVPQREICHSNIMLKIYLSKLVLVHILPYWLCRTPFIPAQHKICEARQKQVVISWTELNAIDVIFMQKGTQLIA